jgi:hypothetical protein
MPHRISLFFYEPFMQAKNRESGEIVALKRVRLDDDDEGVPSSALREICLLKVRKRWINSMLRIRCLFDPGSGMGKKVRMNNPDHLSESVEIIFWVKYLKSLMRIRDRG